MTKTQFLTTVIASSLLAGCSLVPQSLSTTSTQSPAEASLKLSEIIKTGGSANCTITDLTTQKTTTMAVSGKKMKITGTQVQGKTGTYLSDGTYIYMWDDSQKSGIKMKLPTQEEIEATTQKTQSQTQDYEPEKYTSLYEDESKFKLDCKKGSLGDAEFIPPSDITFTDIQSMMQNAIKAMPSIPAMPNVNY